MPLHLLGKKSWNPYSAANIERVRRDEAKAKALEEAEEQRMQEEDAERRIAILRGEIPPPPILSTESRDQSPDRPQQTYHHHDGESPGAIRDGGQHVPPRERKKRKRTGEDDTSFELRLARDRDSSSAVAGAGAGRPRKPTSSAPLVNKDGHFDLFGDERARVRTEKNEDAEREAAVERRKLEDQYRMRLANAAGKDGLERKPWYAGAGGGGGSVAPESFDPPSKDVWGNEDPRRRERDMARLSAGDPLAMMKKGATKAREVKKARANVRKEQDDDLMKLIKEERRKVKHERREERRRRRHEDEDKSERRSDRGREHRRDGREGASGRKQRSASPFHDRERHSRRRCS